MWKKISIHEGESDPNTSSGQMCKLVSQSNSLVFTSLNSSGKRIRDHVVPVGPELICGKKTLVSPTLKVGQLVPSQFCRCGANCCVGVSASGAKFLSCHAKKCAYHKWADELLDPHFAKLAYRNIRWECYQSPRYKFLPADRGSVPEMIVQGGLGDCWFLSAVCILCGNLGRLNNVIAADSFTEKNSVTFRFCIDGVWRNSTVNGEIPLYLHGPRHGRPVFARVKDNVVFGPLIEKAYAQAHGCYESLVGGHIFDALFDLTGCPVEHIYLKSYANAEDLWAQMISWHHHGFLIGCSTSQSSLVRVGLQQVAVSVPVKDTGLVPNHVYSVLDLIELHDVTVGKQLKLTDMFKGEAVVDRIDRLRLVQVRNPWGRKAWKNGEWGAKSERWTRTLTSCIPDYKECEGKFWMTFEDFVDAFAALDVAKTHEDWFSLVVESTRSPLTLLELLMADSETEILRISSPFVSCWCYVTVVQPSLRGKEEQGYRNLGIALVDTRDQTVRVSRFGEFFARVVTVDTFLEPGVEYDVIVFTCGDKKNTKSRNVIRIYSAEQVVMSNHKLERSRQLMTSTAYNGLIYDSIKAFREWVSIADGIFLEVRAKATVAVVILYIQKECTDRGKHIHVELKRNTGLHLEGTWKYKIQQTPLEYSKIVGFAGLPSVGSSTSNINLHCNDFHVHIEPHP